MKLELPPPIPAKRASPTKIEPPRPPAISPESLTKAPPPIPPEVSGEDAGPPIPPPRNEASASGKPLPAVSPPPPVPSALSTQAPSNEKPGKPAEDGESAKTTGRSTPELVVGLGVLVLVLGLLIVWANSPASSPSVDASSAASPTTGSESIQPTAAPLETYHVIKVSRRGHLNIRQGPAETYPVVKTLGPSTRGILLLSGRVPNGSTWWREISFGGHTGWVNENYLEADFPR